MRHFFEKDADTTGRRIAIIGSGVAGLSAAWLLSGHNHVTIYEKNPWAGGHANTVDVACPEGKVGVDTGFIVYNPSNYPHFTALLDHLKVESVLTSMSLGVSIGDGRIEYSSKLPGLFAQKRNFFSPRFWGMIIDILKFYDHARGLDHRAVDGLSLGQFLDRENYSPALIEDHVLPMCAAIWSTTPQQMRDYPMQSFLRFFTSHGLLQVTNRPQWRTVLGGSRSYVQAMIAQFGPKVDWRPGATGISRAGNVTTVTDAEGGSEIYSDVVIAAHADEALGLLADPSHDERTLLGAFRYTDNTAVLHDDRSLMPSRKSVWASWNYIGSDRADADRPLCVSYWMNHLQSLKTQRQLFLTLNPLRAPKPDSVVAAFDYTHPLFDAGALAAQNSLWQLQGRRNTWFCGSYFGYGFHEDALQSGLAVAEALGAVPPWAAKPWRIATEPELLQAAQ